MKFRGIVTKIHKSLRGIISPSTDSSLSVATRRRRSVLSAIALLLVIGGLVTALPAIMRYTREANAAAPTISGISPAKGPQAGGNTVTITGSNFLNAGAFKQIVTGAEHSCGLTQTSQVYCWGSNQFGQLGNTTNSGVNGVGSNTPPPRSIRQPSWQNHR